MGTIPKHHEGNNDTKSNNDENNMKEWSALMDQIAVSLDSKEYVQRFWREGTRPDGRLFAQTRPTSVQLGPLQTRYPGTSLSNDSVAGSSMVALGETRVLGGVTLAVGQQATADQMSSSSSTSSSVMPTCRGDVLVTLSPPCGISDSLLQQQWIPIQNYIQRILDETLNLEQLSLESLMPNSVATTSSSSSAASSSKTKISMMALRLNVALQVLNHDGNIWDAALLASIAALHNTTLPDENGLLMDDNGQVWFREVPNTEFKRGCPFQLPILPIPLTLGMWVNHHREENDNQKDGGIDLTGHHWITDPTLMEEESGHLNSALTVVVDAAAGGQEESSVITPSILSLEYSGTASIAVEDDLLVALHMASARAQEMCKLLRSGKVATSSK